MAEKTVCISQQQTKPIKILKWKVREGNTVAIGRIILLYDFVGAEKSEQRKLKCTQAGTVRKIIAQEGATVIPGETLIELKACNHPTIMNDMCAECGADLRKDEMTTTASVPMVHAIPDLKVSEELAQKLGKADNDRLIKDRKLVLLVDLDQTLIHTTNDNIPPNIKDVYHFQLHGPHSPWYHTRLRPGTHEFLKNIYQYFELHICTFGARNYAHTIAMFLDSDQKFFSNRILSRDECFDPTSKKANLKALFPCGDNMVCIIDDREDVWSHATNLIHVKPYHFFQHTGDINAPPGLEKHENDDKEGLDLTKIIENQKASANEKKVSNGTLENESVSSETSDVNNKNVNINGSKEVDVEGECKENIENAVRPVEGEFKEKIENVDLENGEKNNTEVEDLKEKTTEQNEENNKQEDEKINEKSNENNQDKPNENNQDNSNEVKEGKSNEVKEGKPNEVKEGKPNEEKEDKPNEVKEGKPNDAKEDEPNEVKEDKPNEVKEKSKDESNNDKQNNKDDNLIVIEDPDDYLIYLEEILKRIHKAFYEEFDKLDSGEVPDLKKVIPSVRGYVLSGYKLVFSGLVPTHIKLEQSKAYQVAKSLGAEVTQDLEDDTTHLVAVRPGTAKVNAGRRRKNLKLVTPDWLWSCAERWEHVDERIFPLNSRGSKNRHPPPHCSSPEHITNYPVHDVPALRKRTPSGRFMDTINPLMSFSSADIADMDKEVEDILDDESDSSDDDKSTKAMKAEVLKDREIVESSSSEESLTGEFPKGFKRKRPDEFNTLTEDPNNSTEEDDSPSIKFRRGEAVDSEFELDQESQDSEGSVEPPDEVDDGEWNMMGAALEREFLSNN